jgi:hypothetical protein
MRETIASKLRLVALAGYLAAVAACDLAFLASPQAVADEGRRGQVVLDQKLRRRIEESMNSATPRRALRAYDEAFGRVDVKALRAMRDDPNPSIALYALWAMRVEAEEPMSSEEVRCSFQRIESVVGGEIPRSWAEGFIRLYVAGEAERKAMCGQEWYRSMVRAGADSVVLVDSAYGLMLPEDIRIENRHGGVEFSAGGEVTLVSHKFTDEWKDRFGFRVYVDDGITSSSYWSAPRCLVEMRGKRSYIAVRSEFGGLAGVVCCVDRTTGDKIWQANMWGSGANLEHGEVHLQITKRAAVIFGRGRGGVCVEAFDLASGGCVLRATSKLWEVAQLR